MEENPLLKKLVDASGLPEEFILNTLQRLLSHANVDAKSADLEDVRRITADYLLDVFTEILDQGLRLAAPTKELN